MADDRKDLVDIKIVEAVFKSEMKHLSKDIEDIKRDNREFKARIYKKLSDHDLEIQELNITKQLTTAGAKVGGKRAWEVLLVVLTFFLTILGSMYFGTKGQAHEREKIHKTIQD
jgi:hypothetical protein